MKKILAVVVMAGALASGISRGQQKGQQEVALQAAIRKETVEGDRKGAIDAYTKLAKGSDRAVAAKALVRLGQCYEKMGDAEARKAYERVVRDFAEQKDAVAEAQKYLAANASQSETGLDAKLVFTTDDGRFFGQSISRDGRYVAFTMPYGYGTGPVIAIQDLVKREERKIVTAGVYAETSVNGNPDDTAMISPDGRQVAFWSSTTTEGQKLHAINADGSNPRILLSAKTGAVSLCGWSPDGNRILATSSPAGPMNNQLLTISVADGSSKVVASGGVLDARFSPDGRYIAIEKVAQKPPAKGIFTITATGEREVLLVGHNNASHPIWTEDGKRVLFSLSSSTGDNDLWSIRVIDGRPEGIRELVKKGVPRIVGITQNGDLYYAVSRWPSTLYTVDVDPRTGETTSRPTKMATGYENGGAAWSPDGNTLAYRASRIDERFLVLRSVANGQERPLAPTGLPGNFAVRRPPVWFPDGKSILLWFSDAVYQTDLQTGESRQLLKSLKIRTDNHGRFRLAPDGRTVYYTYRDQRADVSLIRQSLDGGTGVEVCRVAGNMSGPSLSPDGTSLVFSAEFNYGTDKEYCTVMIVAAIGGEPREVLRSKTIMQDPVWSKDGRWLFFSTNNEPQVPWGAGRRQDIWRVSIKGGEPKPLNIGLHFAQYLDFSSDGKHLVFSDLTHINELRVMRNLFPPEKPSR